ncbi:thioesterase family protein [Streptomyces europaeiscabiei]|uniref:thioesterase family protein n=1 Tax=Streptomyces europaeiscabiei TaxID=146819 RepID=UPI000E6A7FDC|nr:thioesterase family protein [Streptomyces europaeiscabiei]MDX2528858.1 thioesterase family protein [Streptomyces europaeiscabiei]MDX3780055.1 thioesterase family protein [Streptomyces europaeiscabiei]MDX3838318.1 thioesterase family protein [Streptomyces europaeiscabiei]MDX3846147.1 thioesterase family protein [Streptomyces europaeiscabiei]MDX3865786.1 thioesterase family protein [Streptomyces europaeiscabiei]
MAQASQATIGNSEFDRDTTATRREEGVYDIDLSAGWAITGAVNGGYLLAVLGRALADALPHDDPFTISAHYLTASRPGQAVVRTDVVRTGRTLSTGQASLFQYDDEGREVERIRVLASYGDLDSLPDDVRTTAKPPAIPPIEQCFGSEDAPAPIPGGSALADRLLLKLDPATLGWALGAPSGKGEMRAWFGLADGRDADPFTLLLAVDALPPTAFELGVTGWVPTVELTVHVRCRPAPGPLRVAIVTRNLAGGFLEEDAEVWDSADRLVAQSRQLARVRLSD